MATNALEKAPTAAMLPGKGPVQQGDWFDAVWGERRAEFRQRATADAGAVVFLGDSITQGWGEPGKYFPKYRCANRGISGDTTRGILYRLQEDVLALHPAAVVLLIGTNDIGIGADPADVAANIQAILAALKGRERENARDRMPGDAECRESATARGQNPAAQRARGRNGCP